MNDVEQRVMDTVTVELGLESNEVTSESRLDADLGSDSLDRVELVMALEEEFKVEIQDDEWEKLMVAEGGDCTVGSIVRFLELHGTH